MSVLTRRPRTKILFKKRAKAEKMLWHVLISLAGDSHFSCDLTTTLPGRSPRWAGQQRGSPSGNFKLPAESLDFCDEKIPQKKAHSKSCAKTKF